MTGFYVELRSLTTQQVAIVGAVLQTFGFPLHECLSDVSVPTVVVDHKEATKYLNKSRPQKFLFATPQTQRDAELFMLTVAAWLLSI
jgi:hypothetical protein